MKPKGVSKNMEMIQAVRKNLDKDRSLLAVCKKRLNSLADLPVVRLCCKMNGKHEEYYFTLTGSRKQHYINKDDSQLIAMLKTQKHFQVLARRLENNIALQEKFLRAYCPSGYDEIEAALPKAYRSVQKMSKENPWDFSFKTTNRNEMHKYADEVLHVTSTGEKVRSKSEVIIYEFLKSAGLDFEYEQPVSLKAGDKWIKFRPDFTFVNRYGEKIYWEHLGMLGKPGYRQDALWKLGVYIDNGFILTANLFLTAESTDGAINVSAIMRTIKMIKEAL